MTKKPKHIGYATVAGKVVKILVKDEEVTTEDSEIDISELP